MFDKNKFAQILKKINETYDSQRDFSKKSEINRTYLSQYMNMKLDEPPKPKILEKLANASNNIINYEELMKVCGYIKDDDNDNSTYLDNKELIILSTVPSFKIFNSEVFPCLYPVINIKYPHAKINTSNTTVAKIGPR